MPKVKELCCQVIIGHLRSCGWVCYRDAPSIVIFYSPNPCYCCNNESIVVNGFLKGSVKPFSPMLMGKFYVHIYMARRSSENYSLLPHPGR